MSFTFTYKGQQLQSGLLPTWEQELRDVRRGIGELHDRYLREGLGSADAILPTAEKLASQEERLCEIINLARSMQEKRDRLEQWSAAVNEAKRRGDIVT